MQSITKKTFPVVLLTVFVCIIFLSSCSVSLANDETIPKWSEELEYQVKKAYYNSLCDDTNFAIDEINMTYYGSYSGYEAVLNTGIGASIINPIEVGGHLFQFGSSNVILLYKDDTFIEFQVAFKDGKITQADIDRLYEVYINAPYT